MLLIQAIYLWFSLLPIDTIENQLMSYHKLLEKMFLKVQLMELFLTVLY